MKRTSSKAVLFYLLGAVVIASLVRFFQYVSIMDFETGYYLLGSEAAGILIYIILAVLSALLVPICIIGKRKNDAAYTVSSDGMGDHATQILGCSFLAAAVVKLIGQLSAEFDLMAALGYLAALLTALVGLVLLGRKEPPAFIGGYIGIPLSVYFFLQTAICFNSDLTVLNHSDQLLVLISLVLGTAFMASVSRFFARIETRNSRMREIITSGLTFIVSGTHVLSKLMAFLFGGSAVSGMQEINPDTAFFALTSAGFLIMLFCTEKRKEITYIITEEEENS